MQPFFISPMESLWLGFALEEYKEVKHDCPDTFLVDFLPSRLGFVPEMACTRTVRVSLDDLPEDIEWFSYGNGEVCYGLAASEPKAIFHEEGEAFCKTIRDTSRRSLKDLLLEYLAPYLATSPFDRFMEFSPDFDELRKTQDLIHRFLWDEDSEACDELHNREGEDDVDAIFDRMHILAEHNGCRAFFDSGRSFASVFACCQRYEKNFLDKSMHQRWTAFFSKDW